jgi:hypothetical protein
MTARIKRLGARLLGAINPVAVRDLRQKVRGRSFTGAFVGLQLTTALAVLPAVLSSGVRSEAEVAAVLFWIPTGFVLILVLPLMLTAELRSERQGGLLELTLATGLSPRRVLWGKWLASAVAIVLLAVSLAPYAVVRYFVGGLQLTREGLVFGNLVLLALFFLAECAGLTAWQRFSVTALAAGLVGIAMLFTLQSALAMAVYAPGVALPDNERLVGVALVLALTAVSAVLFVEFGAYHLSVPAEREAWLARLLGWVAAGAAGFATRWFSWEGFRLLAFWWAAVVAAGVVLAALCEAPLGAKARLPRLIRLVPFARLVFTPGWPAGVCASIVTLIVLAASAKSDHTGQLLLGILGALLMPLLVLIPLRRRIKALSFGGYILIQLVAAAPALLDSLGRATETPWMRSLGETLAPILPLSFMLAGGVTSPGEWEWPAHASFVAASLTVSLGVVALAVWELARASRGDSPSEAA